MPITVTYPEDRKPFGDINVTKTTTQTPSETYIFDADTKCSDFHYLLVSGDTLTISLDLDGNGTHVIPLLVLTTTSGSTLSGRSFQAGQRLIVSMTGGNNGPGGWAIQFEAHKAG
jgi:hypothetical protein